MALSRRAFAKIAVCSTLAGLVPGCSELRSRQPNRIPVVLDSDIGDDIDDTWALLMLLRCPQLDLRLAVTDYGKAIYRGRLYAKLLELAHRTDVPIGLGLEQSDPPGLQSGWVGDYQLSDYPGLVHANGIDCLIDTILRSPEPVTLISLGPVMNVAEALRREPAIAKNARFVGMYGSIRVGYGGSSEPAAEWNVKVDPKALQAVFDAPWDITITPLDTCGSVVLDGDNYRRLATSTDPWLKALMENYRTWLPGAPYVDPATNTNEISTTLFDTVAVYLAFEQELVRMETLPIRVSDDGYTVIDRRHGRPVQCATAWKDLAAFETRLTQILLPG